LGKRVYVASALLVLGIVVASVVLLAVPTALAARGTGSESASSSSGKPMQCADPGKCFAVSVCSRIGALLASTNVSSLPSRARATVSRVENLCREAVRSSGATAFRSALAAAKLFGLVAPLVVKHINRTELASLEYRIIARGVELRMSVIEKLEIAASQLARFNATRGIAKQLYAELEKAKQLLNQSLALARNGSIVRAEEKLAYATSIIVRCGRLVNAVLMRARMLLAIGFRRVAIAARAISIAARALREYNASSRLALLKVAESALSLADKELRALGTGLQILGLYNASRAIQSVVTNVSRSKSLVAMAISCAEKGNSTAARELAEKALREIETVITVARHRRLATPAALHRLLASARRSIALCVSDELGSLALARSMLLAIARHSRNPSARLEAQLLLLIIDSYVRNIAAHPPHHSPCHWVPHPTHHGCRCHHHHAP